MKMPRAVQNSAFSTITYMVWIPLSYFLFYGFLPEPNLQESDEGRDSHHSFLACEPLWTCAVRVSFLPLPNNNAKNIMDMSEELKSNALLDSQVVEQGQECEDTEMDGLYSAAVAILQQKAFDALDKEGADAALSTLEDFYSQYDIVKGFQYYALKVSFLIKLLSSTNDVDQINAIGFDSVIEEIESFISIMEKDENADSEVASSLISDFKDDLEQMKQKLEFVKDFNHVNEQIQKLRDPKKVMMGSKIEDAEKAFSLWDEFYERNELEKDDDYYQMVTQIYNSLFYALTIHQNELKKLPVTLFSHYCFDAKACAIKSVKFCEDEGKDKWLALQERIGEQVEELKEIRSKV